VSGSFESVEWDAAKSEKNRLLRGFGFAYAARVFLEEYVEEESRGNFGERRFVVTGAVDDLVLTLVWTPRGTARRIISARRASRSERRMYYAYYP